MDTQRTNRPSAQRPDSCVWPPRTLQPSLDIAAQFSLDTKNAVLLHPRRAQLTDRFASKVGGTPAWPAGEAWPNCSEHHMPFVSVIQLTQNDVPELPFPARSDLFQLLWCPEGHDDEGYGPLVTTRWRSSKNLGPLLNNIPRLEKLNALFLRHVPKECAVHPELITESDPMPENTDEINTWINEHAKEDLDAIGIPQEYRDDAYSFFAEAPSTKVGGFPSWVQDPDEAGCACGRVMHHLLTVSSDDVGDGYSGFRWAPSDVLRDETGFRICTSIEGTELCLGDCGRVYIFVCTHCESRPVVSVFQCS